MKRSLNSLYHLVITVLIVLILVESMVLLFVSGRGSDLRAVVNDVQTIIIIFVLVSFIYGIIIYNYIPQRLNKSLQEVNKIVSEISHGNYNVEINLEKFNQDKDIQTLLMGLKTMLRSVHGFDQAKEMKIFEHDQRLKQLINLLPQGTLIVLSNGDVSYCNDALRRRYTLLNEVKNINEMSLKSDFDQKIFGKISEALRYGDNLYDVKIPDTNYQQQAVINGSVVRNGKGEPIGGVFVLNYI